MKLSKNVKPIGYLKASTAKVIEKLKTGHQPMGIAQNGEVAMEVQSAAASEQTQETLALLKMLAQSQRALSEGKTVSSEEAFSRLRERRA